ncbi:Abi family protein [bacterium]|nr:Abi family protein [bacterium]
MQYKKPSLTFEQQADQLISRGLIADRDLLTSILGSVNYYRLSTYWYPFRNPDNTFKPDITIEKIWRRYTFDRQLRLIVLDAIERIEIAVKTKMTEIFTTHHQDAFVYLNPSCLRSKNKSDEINKLQNTLRDAAEKSHEEFVKHFKQKYLEHNDLPLWMASELMTFGNMLILYQELEKHIQVKVAKCFDIPGPVLNSWLRSLNYVRNICAHHGRLRDRELAIKPFIPEKRIQPEWYEPVDVFGKTNRMFSILTILRYLLRIIAPKSCWQERFLDLLNRYKELPWEPMGFPKDWQECPIWKNQQG